MTLDDINADLDRYIAEVPESEALYRGRKTNIFAFVHYHAKLLNAIAALQELRGAYHVREIQITEEAKHASQDA